MANQHLLLSSSAARAEGSRQTMEVQRQEPRRGKHCPRCKHARLDYDGCLNLTCTACGYINAGAFT